MNADAQTAAGGYSPAQARTLTVQSEGPITITLEDREGGRVFLLLHGGGGVPTMRGFAGLLATRTGARVLLPTHPGFAGTPTPARPINVRGLAAAYIALLDALELSNVTVVGNSFGGWLAAEMALGGSPRVSGAVIINGVGIEVPGHPMTPVAGLSRTQILSLSFHDPAKAPTPPPGQVGPSPDVQALINYAGPAMSDPTLLRRLGGLALPVQVVWGESDRIVDQAYGRAFAAAIPLSTFTLLPSSGHLPQLETPEELLAAMLAPAA